ncbi:hypothetical protein CKO_00676 [Citrobacter koseri ATCC BAA-895]|uniref:Uncharacterized protein n=1 Tax=Citrobacter koseri (strain ATCC BAA-895 / CDC 4225-83 / SGSC4696) TaxID=290338 RepID=A8AEB6_CITK8|nr:hypothetical protein CKO_00676 [Citrobacter koseri ATCC BAA-895]
MCRKYKYLPTQALQHQPTIMPLSFSWLTHLIIREIGGDKTPPTKRVC